jgi:exodeoxyribonuclease-3
MAFKVATFNVNSIRSRLHIVIPWLRENRPDVLCMQETKVENRKFPESDFHRIGYHVVFSGSKGRNGVAIASLDEADEVEVGFDTEPRDEDRLIKARFGDVVIVNTYVPQGYRIDSPRYQYKLDWFGRLKEYFKNNVNLEGNVIWCGDINVAPDDIDVHNPKRLKDHVCFHTSVRKAFESVKNLGFVDVFRKHHPTARQYTFYDYRVKNAVERGLGWRVDHILTTEALAERSVDCYIDLKPRLMSKPSDHTVLVAVFELV